MGGITATTMDITGMAGITAITAMAGTMDITGIRATTTVAGCTFTADKHRGWCAVRTSPLS